MLQLVMAFIILSSLCSSTMSSFSLDKLYKACDALLDCKIPSYRVTIYCSVTIVVDDFIISLLKKLNSGESLYLNIFQLIRCRVHLCNHDPEERIITSPKEKRILTSPNP